MPVLKEGFPFIFPSLAAGIALLIAPVFVVQTPAVLVCIILGSLSIIFSFFCVFFFRDPKISITQGDGIILSPCNGTVMEITEEGDEKIIRVFLSIFSVHLQRSPVDGVITGVTHKNGKYYAAWNPRAQSENEQNIITIQSDNLKTSGLYVVRQIAGLVARRCVSWVKQGDVVKAGDKIGMIKFSSQVDLHLPLKTEIIIKEGEKTRAGITIMAVI
ncbi:MAG: phosphatidylserine decarboxylase [Treponema sp.]|nr:phosphatidylserine decarboxylase [Treponema sp.]